jgi:hypothetical protein
MSTITRNVVVGDDTAAAGYAAAVHLVREQAEVRRGQAESARHAATEGRGLKGRAAAEEAFADGVAHALAVLEHTELQVRS